MASDRPLLLLSPPTASPSPSPSPQPTDTNNSDVPRSSSKKVTISSESRNATKSSDTFSFNPHLRSSSKSSSSIEPLPRSGSTRPPLPARYSSRRSDSNRFGSQRDIPDEEARFVYINDPDRTNSPPVQFPNNSIKTTKYSVITFLPRNLFEQFHRVAYVYFLVLVALNQVPQLGVFSPAASVLPLAFVLGVTAVKDGYEDWRRHRSDRIENNRSASVLVGSEFQPRPWKSVRVGELIRVGSNETLPCDLVVLSTSDPTGVAYVQTINLDGESNLKTRYAKQETQLIPHSRVSGLIRCEKPNRNIYGFHATVDVDGKRVSLGPANIILRGCELKNTNWVIGVAVYTGKETKVMLNSSGAPSKRSRLETHMNRETIMLAVALFTVCTIVTVLAGLWLHRHEDQLDTMPYYRKKDFSGKEIGKYDYYGIGWQITFTFFMSVIQFQVMIPIALYISMELVRLGQAFFMIQDRDMYHEATDSRFQCRALNINEDLGQIKYVFSDKTGTLTENKMEFQCASIRGVDYSGIGEETEGGSVSVDGQVWRPKLKVKPDPDLLHLLKHGGGTEKGDRARDFFLALAACNTIVPIIADTPDPSQKLIDYQGESPDEQALVYAAAAYGFMLIERTSGHIVVDVHGQKQSRLPIHSLMPPKSLSLPIFNNNNMINSEGPLLAPSPRPLAPALRSSTRSLDRKPPSSAAVRYGSRAESDRSASFFSSQKEIADGDARIVHVNDPTKTSESNSGQLISGNSIKTTKYSLFTFLPRNLFEQFHRLAYVYFLIIAVLNQLPQLAVFGRGASILPLAFVLLVTAVKDVYEDYRRHRSDCIENNRTALVLLPDSNSFNPKRWEEIRVGEILKVLANETLPCDMVLLATSDPTGVAYVQTINLDGESNLKTRYAKQETINTLMKEKVGAFSFSSFSGVIRCERPNRNIYGFHANMEIDGKRVSLGPSNIILRGCELKNTAWAVGVVVYAGRETKVMLNSSGAPSKRSRLETHMNRETLLLSTLLIALCSAVTVCAGIWLGNHKDELDYSPFFRKRQLVGDEKNYNYYGIALEVFFTFLKSVIVFQIMIPISLYISMELVRLGQAYFMIRDRNLYDEASNSRFQCRALNINEDLGQIKFVFSDKTGTLTENKMEFQRASLRGVDYSGGKAPLPKDIGGVHTVIGDQFWRPKMTVKTDPELVRLLRSGKETEERKCARKFFLSLAACNTIVPLVVDTPDPKQKLIDYQGESPDEQALVYAAAAYGFVLIERTSGHIVIDVLGDRQRYDVLGLHEFDSDRKRMSVIVGCPDKTVKLFVKGADSSMFGVIDKSLDLDVIHATESHLHKYSSLGLRTLVIGTRQLSTEEFGEWQSAYERASTVLFGRGGLLRAVAANIECNLQLLGSTGIEDKLQEGVPEAIESLRQAGIKVWVLTGDKQETAISIGYSCKLLSSDMTPIIINSRSKESCRKSLEDAIAMSRKLAAISPSAQDGGFRNRSRIPLALIIDGTSLVYILETELEEELFKVATACDVVLCCRVAPLQKAGIVALIKNRTDDMTLAIGDGANDVSMIQMADVGIGISGQEGRQAVMASDFAMGQFRFLVPLLLVHGHWNYQRMAYMILYNFYRNAVFVFMLFWYVLYTAFSLTTAITEWSSVLYSVIYTALPTIIVGVLDKDLSRKTLLKYPQLYGAGQREERYNIKLFILTMMDTIWQSLAIFFIPYLAYRHSTVDGSSIGDLWTLSVVIIVNIHLAMDVFRWNWMTHASIWGCMVATIICIIVIDALPMLPGYWAIFHVMGTAVFWFCLLGVIVTAMVPRLAMKSITEYIAPSDIQIARELEKFGSVNEATVSEIPMSTFSNSQHQSRQ